MFDLEANTFHLTGSSNKIDGGTDLIDDSFQRIQLKTIQSGFDIPLKSDRTNCRALEMIIELDAFNEGCLTDR